MSGYLFFQWVRHLLRAKSRHGVHSPFVFEFVEQILNRRERFDQRMNGSSFPGMTPVQAALLTAIADYYKLLPIWDVDTIQATPAGYSGILYITGDYAEAGIRVSPADMVALIGIHESSANQTTWEKLYNGNKVSLSLELFNIGILLFREEFKVKQHFRLRASF